MGAIMKKFLFSLTCLAMVACGGGSGDPEKEGPRGTEIPYRGVVSGPDGEVARVGVEDAPNSAESGVTEGNTSACNDADSCLELCACAGQGSSACAQLCGDDDYEFDSGGDAADICESFSDPCERCACENLSNPTV